MGANLIIIKCEENHICGGFTSKSWGIKQDYYQDNEAFLFNMETKFTPIDQEKAIFTWIDGLMFGICALSIRGNEMKEGVCRTDGNNYTIDAKFSPITNLKDKFKCAELEVFRVVY